MPGRPFYAHEATDEQRQHVFSQYSKYLTEVARRPLKTACSLRPSGNAMIESEVASDRFFHLEKQGPYGSAVEYFTSIADLHLDLDADGQLYVKYPREAYVFYKLLRDQVAPVLAQSSAVMDGYYLKHVDDKGDYLLVDENYNITAIIDWQFARFVPACEAFGPPLFTADMGQLYGGVGGLSESDKFLAGCLEIEGSTALAGIAKTSELACRFHFGLATGLFKDEVREMTWAVLALLEESWSFKQVSEVWLKEMLPQNPDDPRLDKLSILIAEQDSLETAVRKNK